MVATDPLAALVAMSRKLGADPAYVQGGGGNTSAKPGAGRMLVKASGTLLAEMTADHGLIAVDVPRVRALLADAPEDDDAYSAEICAAAEPSAFRPSMEAGFHAVLGPVVAHTHSIYLNVMTCAAEGEALAAEVFPEAAWIPYLSPGRALSLAVAERPGHAVYLLQNHGVIVSGADAGEVLALHEEVNARIRDRLDLPEGLDVDAPRKRSLDEIRAGILFPDQVVFTSAGPELLATRAARETLAAYDWIRDRIAERGLTPHFLPQAAGAALLGMEMEKNRQGMAR